MSTPTNIVREASSERNAETQYDTNVWAPIDLTAGGTPLTGTTGRHPYPPTCYGNHPGWAMRLSPSVIALDIDHYDGKTGRKTIDALEAELGELPSSYRVTARGIDNPSGKVLFAVPDGWTGRDPGDDVELLRCGHRFIAMGTHRKTGNEVVIYDEQTGEIVSLDEVYYADIPDLPSEWLDHLSKAASAHEDGTPDDGSMTAPNPVSFPLSARPADNSVPGRTKNDGYAGGLLGYARDARRHGASEAWITAELERVALDERAADPWTEYDLAVIASEAVRVTPVDKLISGVTSSSLAPVVTSIVETPLDGPESDEDEADDNNGWGHEPVRFPPFTHLQIGAGGYAVRAATPVCLYAPPSYGKTAVAIQWAMQEAIRGRRVLWCDLEMQRANLEDTIRESGNWELFTRQVTYTHDLGKFFRLASRGGYDIVFLDSYQVAVQRMDIDTRNASNTYAAEFGAYFERMVRPVVSQGTTFVTLDHATKVNRENPNKFELSGADRKGADYRLIIRLERHGAGYARIIADKDSYARKHRDEGYGPWEIMGHLKFQTGEFTLVNPGDLYATLDSADDPDGNASEKIQRVVTMIARTDYSSKHAVSCAYKLAYGGSMSTARRDVDLAVTRNVIDPAATPVGMHPDADERYRNLFRSHRALRDAV